MKILIAHGDSAERKRLAHIIGTAHHSVIEADCTSAVASVLDREPEVVFVDWAISGGGGAALVQFLRALSSRHRHYVIVSCRRPDPREISAIFRSGADDFVTPATSADEVLARVDGLKRIRAWAKHLRAEPNEFAQVFDLEQLRFWRELQKIVTTELGEMLGARMEPVAIGDSNVQWVGTVPLSLASEQIEVRLGVGLDLGASDLFVKEVLHGDANSEAMKDALRELANVAGGAIKREALDEGIAITIGLPSNENLFMSPNARRWSATTASGLRVTFGAVALACHSRQVPRGELREGMVLASDVRTAAGLLLVAAGTYLTSSTVDRLSRFLDGMSCVAVTETLPIKARARAQRDSRA